MRLKKLIEIEPFIIYKMKLTTAEIQDAMHDLSMQDEDTRNLLETMIYIPDYVFTFPRRDGNTEFYYQALDRVWTYWKRYE